VVAAREGSNRLAAIKYDVSDVEAGGGGEQPQPNLYKGKIVSVKHREKNARGEACNDLEVVVDVGSEFSRLWTYIQLDNQATKWKLREFTDAVGLAPKGTIDPAKLKGKPVTVKVAADTDLDGNYRGKIKNLFLPGSAPGEGSGESNGAEASSEEEPWTEEDLQALSTDELKAELEAFGLKLAGRFNQGKAIAAILEAQGEGDGEGEGEGEGDGEPAAEIGPELAADLSTDPDSYAEWSDDEIKEYIDDLDIAGNLTGRKTRQKMIDHIVAFAEEQGGEGGEGGEAGGAPEDDYDEWPDNELADEVNTRIEQGAEIKITGRKTKEKLVAALRADDASGEPF
jgi:hypothetical protein